MGDNILLEPRNRTLQKISGWLLIILAVVVLALMVLVVISGL